MFNRQHPKFSTWEDRDEKEHTRVYTKGDVFWYNVSETPEEIEALINEKEVTL